MSLLQNIRLIFLSGTGSLFNVLISMVRVKVVALVLGTNGVAIFGQLANLINISSLLSNLGMSMGLVTEVSRGRARKDIERIKSFKIIFSFSVVLGSIVTSILIYSFSRSISSFLFQNTSYNALIQLVAVNTCFLGISSIIPSLLKADKKIKLLTIFTVLSSLTNGILTILFVVFFKLEGILYGMIFANLIAIFFGFFIFKKHRLAFTSNLNSILTQNYWAKLKLLLGFGTISLFTSVLIQSSNIGLKSLIIYKSSVHEAGLFQAAANISNQYLPIVLTSLGAYLLPQLAENLGEKISLEANYSLRAILIIFVPVLIFISLLSTPVISLLYSEEFKEAGIILSVILISDILKITNRVLGTIIIATRDFKVWLSGDMFAAIFPLIVAYILYDFFNVLSVPIAILISYLILFVFYIYMLQKRHNFHLERKSLFLILSSILLLASIFIFSQYVSLIIVSLFAIPIMLIVLYLSLSFKELKLIQRVFEHIF